MSSDELLARKLENQLSIARDVGGGVGLPSIDRIPHPSKWGAYNGYKVAYEKNMNLKKSYQIWYENTVPDEPQPKIKSLYPVVKKFSERMAEEYAKIYGKG
jgi:hypothetical protein